MRGLAADTMRGEGERAWGPRWSRAEAAGDVPATVDGVRGSTVVRAVRVVSADGARSNGSARQRARLSGRARALGGLDA